MCEHEWQFSYADNAVRCVRCGAYNDRDARIKELETELNDARTKFGDAPQPPYRRQRRLRRQDHQTTQEHMSRNLLRTDCYFCNGRVVVEEAPRPILETEARVYFYGPHGYEGMLVANARCFECEAKYLAWVDETTKASKHHYDRKSDNNEAFFDLSFRSTFNDEPGENDLPERESYKAWRPWPRCEKCSLKKYDGYGCRCEP